MLSLIRGRKQRPAALLTAAYLLFGLAWVFTNPPGFAPDEPSHYIKAIGIGHGEWLGEPAPFTYLPVVDEQMLAWQNRNTRSISVPRGMGACLYYRLPIDGRCPEGLPPPTPAREPTYVATYPPFMYIPAALAMRLASTTDSALLVGRLATLIVSTALVGAAAFALGGRRGGDLGLAGLVAAVTPSVLFIFAELSASGPEIAGGVCFAACLIRLTDADSPRWLWPALLLSGVVLASSRTFGPLWVAFDIGWWVLLLGRGGFRGVLRRASRWAVAAGAATTAAAALNLAWQAAVAPRPPVDVMAIRHGLAMVAKEAILLAKETVGVFGWVDIPLPRVAAFGWAVAVGVFVVAAFTVAGRRERVALGGFTGGVIGLTCVVAVAIAASAAGFGLQARYVLPALIALPLLAAEMLRRHHDVLSARVRQAILPAAALVAAGVQALSIWVNSQFYVDKVKGYVAFIGPTGWTPPLGWGPWVGLSALAVALLLAAAATASQGNAGQRNREVP